MLSHRLAYHNGFSDEMKRITVQEGYVRKVGSYVVDREERKGEEGDAGVTWE